MSSTEGGQALLEVAITIGVIAVVVAALTVVTIMGLRNSQFAKNQAQATKLAQEGIEYVRSIRDRDYIVCTSSDASSCRKWSTVWDYQFTKYTPADPPSPAVDCDTSKCLFKLSLGVASCTFPPSLSSPFCLKQSDVFENIAGGVFRRRIKIEDYDDDPQLIKKKVTSIIEWTDITGKHKSELISILAKF